jgi:Flp pilus assembly pilin Flp
MLISLLGPEPELSSDVDYVPPPIPKRRRGTTALEYLVCISTILVVVIITVQHLGSVVGNKFTNNAKATGATIKGGP